MTISACWIVKNEAANIRASILSVKDCCDELIVVDTGSTDDTVHIAEECGAGIAHFTWTDDFAAAKNFALSLAKGDFVLFLDADEYFVPPLAIEDRECMQFVFDNTDMETLQIVRTELDTNSGKILGKTVVDRFLRRGAVHFENKIHEIPKNAKGKPPTSIVYNGLTLLHSGYSGSVFNQKLLRNIKILESEQKRLVDPLSLYLNAQYLMREYFALHDYTKAAEYLRCLLDRHEHAAAACKLHGTGMLQRFLHALSVASMRRAQFSKEEIYDKLVTGMKENYPKARESVLIDLYYQLLFDYREDRYLRELEALEAGLTGTPGPSIAECAQVESAIFTQGAEAASIRGDTEKAKRWAERAHCHAEWTNYSEDSP